jgi:hypothetical protein
MYAYRFIYDIFHVHIGKGEENRWALYRGSGFLQPHYYCKEESTLQDLLSATFSPPPPPPAFPIAPYPHQMIHSVVILTTSLCLGIYLLHVRDCILFAICSQHLVDASVDLPRRILAMQKNCNMQQTREMCNFFHVSFLKTISPM